MRVSEDIKIKHIDDDQNAYIEVNDKLICIGEILSYEIENPNIAHVYLNKTGREYFRNLF
jgi:hypothetical protein